MKYVNVGKSGLQVSAVTLGCMSYGDPDKGHGWSLPEAESRHFIRRALEARHHHLRHRERLLRWAAARRSSAAPWRLHTAGSRW